MIWFCFGLQISSWLSISWARIICYFASPLPVRPWPVPTYRSSASLKSVKGTITLKWSTYRFIAKSMNFLKWFGSYLQMFCLFPRHEMFKNNFFDYVFFFSFLFVCVWYFRWSFIFWIKQQMYSFLVIRSIIAGETGVIEKN